MTITKSYNRQNGVYYAYETTYEWSEEKQKKVQRKHCIGQFDPITGDVVPNGKIGRPSLFEQNKGQAKKEVTLRKEPAIKDENVKKIVKKLSRLEDTTRSLLDEIHDLTQEVNALSQSKS